MTTDEKNLVREFRAGEAGSFETLYRDYGTRLYRFCRRICGNDTDAEDLTQEVFLAAYRGASRFEGRCSLTTWLYRIALYRWRTLCRLRLTQTIPLDESAAAFSSDPAQIGLDKITLERALSALPENLREAFLLVKGEGLLCREAAEVLGIPEGTLKSRVQTAIVRLHSLLESEESVPPAKQSAKSKQKKEVCNEL